MNECLQEDGSQSKNLFSIDIFNISKHTYIKILLIYSDCLLSNHVVID